jgi:hypothetical protein
MPCVNQVIRPTGPWFAPWRGDCKRCTESVENLACPGYRPFPTPHGPARAAYNPIPARRD